MIQKTCVYGLIFTGRELMFFTAAHVMLLQICDQISVNNSVLIAAEQVLNG